MDRTEFQELLNPLLTKLDGWPLDATLEAALNAEFPSGGAFYNSVLEACRQGDTEGWICNREAGGIRYGRVIKPGAETHGFSVDIVQMREVVGPHHVHPNGEIDLVMPTDGHATFDQRPAGWMVYGPGSAHSPAVEGGCAYVLYLLPDGAIRFTS